MELHRNTYTSSSSLGGASTSEGKQNKELDIHIGKAMRASHYLVVVRRELSRKSKAHNFRNSLCPFSPTLLLYGHETLVMIKRVRLQVQSSKNEISPKNHRSYIIEKVHISRAAISIAIRKSLELLFLQIKRSQLR